MSNEELFELVKELQDMLLSYSTGGRVNDERYGELRRVLKREPVTARLLPDFVNSSRDLGQFWGFIKFEFDNYADRRQFIWKAFGPLLDLLEGAPAAAPGPATFWAVGAFKLFISHVSAFKVRAESLKRVLKPFAVSAFVAHSDIEPTAEWLREIEAGLFSCDALLALLTPDFHASNWTDQEVGVAFGRGKLIIPLRVDKDPYGFIGQFQGLAAKGKTPVDLAPDILRIFARHARTRRAYAEAVTRAIEGATNVEAARRMVGVVDFFPSLDDDLVARLKRAGQTNRILASTATLATRLGRVSSKQAAT